YCSAMLSFAYNVRPYRNAARKNFLSAASASDNPAKMVVALKEIPPQPPNSLSPPFRVYGASSSAGGAAVATATEALGEVSSEGTWALVTMLRTTVNAATDTGVK